MVGAIQTFGDFIHWHPHIHALVSEGMFFPDGTFIPLPKLAIEPFLKLWEHLIRYYGWYSNKQRGQRAKRGPAAPEGHVASPRAPSAREARKRRAALIKQVYEADPMACPQCGSAMKIIGFIERHQGDMIEKILRHCGLWEEAPTRDPPPLPEAAILALDEDWSSGAVDPARWYALRKQWGAGNHGVVPENVVVVREDGRSVLQCLAHGDDYGGPVTGQWGRKTRVGGVLVTKQHFASGRFEVRMKIGTPEQPRPRLAVQRPR